MVFKSSMVNRQSPFAPSEADSPLVVDPNAVLAEALAFQSFEPVSPDGCQVKRIDH